jgi:hypothetical protein
MTLPSPDPDAPEGDERRLVSVRAELLPPLSAGRAHGAGSGQRRVPPRVPLHHQVVINYAGPGTTGGSLLPIGCEYSAQRAWPSSFACQPSSWSRSVWKFSATA